MPYENTVLVLKEVTGGYSVLSRAATGIFRAEKENGAFSFVFSPANLAPAGDGEFYLALSLKEGKIFFFSLGKNPSVFRKTLPDSCGGKGVAVGVIYVENNLPALVCFAASEKGQDIRKFKKTLSAEYGKLFLTDFPFASSSVKTQIIRAENIQKTAAQTEEKEENDDYLREIKIPIKKPPFPAPTSAPVSAPPPSLAYDDEVVATENYYENDGENFENIKKELDEKLKIISKKDENYVRTENGENACRGGKTPQEDGEDADFFEDEENADDGEGRENSENPYFDRVKDNIEAIFKRFPEETGLKSALPKSRFARVYYSKEKYYVVGVIEDADGKEKYICYGVPSKYSDTPPKQLDGFCSFLPLSLFKPLGDGFWMMFQDAVTGKCVKMNK